jgi:hypothetical protein
MRDTVKVHRKKSGVFLKKFCCTAKNAHAHMSRVEELAMQLFKIGA